MRSMDRTHSRRFARLSRTLGLSRQRRRESSPGEHGILVQQFHRAAQQRFSVIVALAIGGEQVVQIERERHGAPAVLRRATGGDRAPAVLGVMR